MSTPPCTHSACLPNIFGIFMDLPCHNNFILRDLLIYRTSFLILVCVIKNLEEKIAKHHVVFFRFDGCVYYVLSAGGLSITYMVYYAQGI